MNPTASSDDYPASRAMEAVTTAAVEAVRSPGEPVADESDRQVPAHRTSQHVTNTDHVLSITTSGTGRQSSMPGTRPMPPTSRFSSPSVESIMASIIGPDTIEFPRSYRIAKRLLDLVGAAIGLIILSPIFLIVAILILLDSSGPVFFKQERVGFQGRPFRMLKFRTMTVGGRLPQDGGAHKRRNDHRVTRVGKILRTTSLDEVPQLINVFRGEMSLVGPRPEILSIVLGKYQPWQYQRFLVPQGMTGWWQVTGRGTKLLYEHTEDDLYYIEHASFWFDLKILLMTVRAVIRREGAF